MSRRGGKHRGTKTRKRQLERLPAKLLRRQELVSEHGLTDRQLWMALKLKLSAEVAEDGAEGGGLLANTSNGSSRRVGKHHRRQCGQWRIS